jgi:tetratricopeptide (TPR) repeat protein
MLQIRILVLLPLCFASIFARAQQGGDIEAQILYAFQIEDSNQLTNVAETLNTAMHSNGADAALRYHLAHAQYRLGLLYAAKNPRGVKPALSECIDQLKANLEQDVNSVESLALQSACYSNLARVEKLEAMLLRSRAESRLDAAFKLAPRNPRVVYLMGVEGLARAKPGSDEYARALAQLKLAVQLFEQTSATSVDVPGWGHAEAYLELGRQLESRGDLLGARNWIEKSLLVAPDFKAAQRQRAILSGH